MRDRIVPIGRGLINSAAQAGGSIDVLEDDFTAWSSATFTGARHLLKITGVRCDALDNWLARLGTLELRLPGHLVADLQVVAANSCGGRTDAHIEALTVVER